MSPDAYKTGQAVQLQCKARNKQYCSSSSLLFSHPYFSFRNKMCHTFSWKKVVLLGFFYTI